MNRTSWMTGRLPTFACIAATLFACASGATSHAQSVADGESALQLVFDHPEPPAPLVKPVLTKNPPAASTEPAASPTRERLPLGSKGTTAVQTRRDGSAASSSWLSAWLTGPMLSLAAVLGLIAVIAGLMRLLGRHRAGSSLRAELGSGGRAPSGLMEVIGRYPMGRGLSLVLLRIERRIVLLSMSTGLRGGGNFTTLTEITDPEEVASILAHAQDAAGTSMAARFQNLLEQSDDRLNEPAIRDRVSKPATQASALTRRSLADGDTRPVISTQTSAAEGLLQRLATMRTANASPAPRVATGNRTAQGRLRDVSA